MVQALGIGHQEKIKTEEFSVVERYAPQIREPESSQPDVYLSSSDT
jgi:hypothetical protein